MQLLEDSATDALKARIVSEQITYRPLLRHEWIEYYEFCKTYACGPTWSNYSTQYDYEIDYQNVTSNFRFRGYFDAQMNAYHRALVERLITEGIMMPLAAILICVVVGWKLGMPWLTSEIEENGNKFYCKKFFEVCVKYVTPLLMVFVFISLALSYLNV
jgi:hypothetical protein